jgi:hypothetical protein
MSAEQYDLDLEWLAADLASGLGPTVVVTDRSLPPSQLWAKGRTLRRRRRAILAVAVSAAVVTASGAALTVAGSIHPAHRRQGELAGGGSADFRRAAQDALGPSWKLEASRTRPDQTITSRPAGTAGMFPSESTRSSDGITLMFTRNDLLSDPPQPGTAHLMIESVRYTDPTPTEREAATYASRGGAASHYPDDGSSASVLIDRQLSETSHVWIVQMPDKNTLIGIVWQADGHFSQIIEPGGATPALDPEAVAALGAALARA